MYLDIYRALSNLIEQYTKSNIIRDQILKLCMEKFWPLLVSISSTDTKPSDISLTPNNEINNTTIPQDEFTHNDEILLLPTIETLIPPNEYSYKEILQNIKNFDEYISLKDERILQALDIAFTSLYSIPSIHGGTIHTILQYIDKGLIIEDKKYTIYNQDNTYTSISPEIFMYICFRAFRLLFVNKYMTQHIEFAIKYLKTGEKPTVKQLPPPVNLQSTWETEQNKSSIAGIPQAGNDILSPSCDASNILMGSSNKLPPIPSSKNTVHTPANARSAFPTIYETTKDEE